MEEKEITKERELAISPEVEAMLSSPVAIKVKEIIIKVQHSNIEPDELSNELDEFDSLQTLELVTALEEEFNITIEDSDLDWDNFQSIASITELVQSKMEEKLK